MSQKDGTGKGYTEGFAFVSVDDLLQVTVPDDPNSATYHSRVKDITEGQIIIAWPTHRRMRLPAKKNQRLSFSYLHNKIPYAFDGVVGERRDHPIPEVAIHSVGPVEKTQRRQNFRVKCLIPVEITGTPDAPAGDDPSKNILFIKTVTVDLSAGGIGVHLPKDSSEGTLVDIKLSLPDQEPAIKIRCRIAYTRQLPENVAMFHWGLQFLAISEREQARVRRYCQRQQLQRLQQ